MCNIEIARDFSSYDVCANSGIMYLPGSPIIIQLRSKCVTFCPFCIYKRDRTFVSDCMRPLSISEIDQTVKWPTIVQSIRQRRYITAHAHSVTYVCAERSSYIASTNPLKRCRCCVSTVDALRNYIAYQRFYRNHFEAELKFEKITSEIFKFEIFIISR